MMKAETLIPAGEAIDLDLGRRTIGYRDADAILYALAVGARASELELVFERELRVLPTFGLTLGLWAVDALGERGFFSSASALHGAQRLEVRAPLPPQGELELRARVPAVWDKGSAAVFEIEVSCECFRAVYSIFAPGCGGFGGERGPSARRDPDTPPSWCALAATSREQAVLYRLTGDRHLIHVDPEAARAIGAERPILHGLCTAGFAVRELAGVLGSHPWELDELEVRFTAPVLPGDPLEIQVWEPQPDGRVRFAVSTPQAVALSGGVARFG
ncbi:MAG: MaoC/PaaZ C-terminal domain-containing protein [Solirubrobacteraceae bacterium]